MLNRRQCVSGGGNAEGIYYQSIAGMNADMSGARSQAPSGQPALHESQPAAGAATASSSRHPDESPTLTEAQVAADLHSGTRECSSSGGAEDGLHPSRPATDIAADR